ncbi:MAG: hypothetical protein UZ05_CHB002002820 [Chlorobi bacterium OLB5]|nr:MAG: hypothetical protein UZ05_CHB002002820 [Chlorobi bacterium OLB5]
MYKKIIWVLAVILFLLLAERLVFTSADLKITLSPEVLKASHNSELFIEVNRVNYLGFKTPFSSTDVFFTVEEGKNLINISEIINGNSVKVTAKGVEGEAVIGIYSIRSGMQIRKVLIKILPRDVAYLPDIWII